MRPMRAAATPPPDTSRKRGGRDIRQLAAIAGLLLAGALVACAPAPPASTVRPSPSLPPITPAPSATGTPLVRPELPATFPVLGGAVAVPLTDEDPGLIAQWTSDLVGAPAYDYYVAALPAAGYRIEGLYPGDGFAVIRLVGAGNELWQLILRSPDLASTWIELRLDRP